MMHAWDARLKDACMGRPSKGCMHGTPARGRGAALYCALLYRDGALLYGEGGALLYGDGGALLYGKAVLYCAGTAVLYTVRGTALYGALLYGDGALLTRA